MMPEHKEKLISRVGIDKANAIEQSIAESNERTRLAGIVEHEKFERMLAAMIPKDQLEGGCWYVGFRFRDSYVAEWDGKDQKFITIRYKWGHFSIEVLNHISDELNTNNDGFIPFKKIEPIIID